SSGVILLAVAGISLIRIDATMLDDLSEEDPIRQDFMYFEQNFSGVRPFEMHLITGPEHEIFDLEVLQEIEKLESYLQSEYGLNFIASPLTVIKAANRSLNGGSNTYYKLPESKAELNKITRRLRGLAKREEFTRLITEDLQEGRLTGKMSDIGSARANVLNDSLQHFIQKKLNLKVLQPKLTGSAVLLDKNNEYLTRNMMEGLMIAFLVIGGIVGLLFRSWKMLLLGLIPNVLPLLMIGAVMGFGGVNLKVSTSIIFTIAFGIAVDDTIHFISKLKLELLSGKSLLYAIKRTFISTGKAIIITSVILVAGFLSLMLSSMDGTFYIGLLISLTLVFAVVADLFLLPVLLIYFYKPSKKRPLTAGNV
ncbi:MAG: MMPL family transporter, partial [Hymenobacteraceae bacterium]|nr:MMPL family transporter [Hymenobacteraceae bacterium]MDX5394946.1 MMPL family transporter [Hymenobacteraceae bacterium]MDX5510980.1 MMPL family transporter [Hymenobacteraceae bacterium]